MTVSSVEFSFKCFISVEIDGSVLDIILSLQSLYTAIVPKEKSVILYDNFGKYIMNQLDIKIDNFRIEYRYLR